MFLIIWLDEGGELNRQACSDEDAVRKWKELYLDDNTVISQVMLVTGIKLSCDSIDAIQ